MGGGSCPLSQGVRIPGPEQPKASILVVPGTWRREPRLRSPCGPTVPPDCLGEGLHLREDTVQMTRLEINRKRAPEKTLGVDGRGHTALATVGPCRSQVTSARSRVRPGLPATRKTWWDGRGPWHRGRAARVCHTAVHDVCPHTEHLPGLTAAPGGGQAAEAWAQEGTVPARGMARTRGSHPKSQLRLQSPCFCSFSPRPHGGSALGRGQGVPRPFGQRGD